MLFPLFLYAQNDNNEYYYKYKLYRINQNQTESNINKDVIDYVGINKVDTIDYELYINNENATFFANQKLSNDQSSGINFTEIIIQTNGSWYYDLKDSLLYNTVEFNNKKFSIKYDYNYIDWHHSQEVEIINGYNCKTATKSKNEELNNGEKRDYKITIWYSDDVSPNAMPFGFVGLPGGIVKINFNGFTEAILDKNNQDDKKKKKKGKSNILGNIVSPSEFEKIQLEHSIKEKELRGGGVDRD